MKKLLIEFLVDTKAQGLVEYGLIITLVILAAISAVELFGMKVEDLFNHIGTKVSEDL